MLWTLYCAQINCKSASHAWYIWFFFPFHISILAYIFTFSPLTILYSLLNNSGKQLSLWNFVTCIFKISFPIHKWSLASCFSQVPPWQRGKESGKIFSHLELVAFLLSLVIKTPRGRINNRWWEPVSKPCRHAAKPESAAAPQQKPAGTDLREFRVSWPLKMPSAHRSVMCSTGRWGYWRRSKHTRKA